MLNFDNIKLGIYKWSSDVTKLDVIWHNPNAPRPNKPYLSLNLTQYNSNGWDSEIGPDNDGNIILIGNREFTVEVNYYGNDGYDVMEDLRTSVRDFNVAHNLGDHGVVFVDRLAQNNLTELLDTKWESRLQAEFRFRVANQNKADLTKTNVGIIESAEIKSNYKIEDLELLKGKLEISKDD